MKTFRFTLIGLIACFGAANSWGQAQPSISKEKQGLIYQFRKATGADNVNVGFNISVEDVRDEMLSTVNGEKELSETEKLELKAAVADAYNRLDKQVKGFLGDSANTAPMIESVITQLYDQAFSETELRDLVAFYNTTTGKKGLQFIRSLNDEVKKSFQQMVLPKVTEFVRPKIDDEYKILNQKIQQAKTKKP